MFSVEDCVTPVRSQLLDAKPSHRVCPANRPTKRAANSKDFQHIFQRGSHFQMQLWDCSSPWSLSRRLRILARSGPSSPNHERQQGPALPAFEAEYGSSPSSTSRAHSPNRRFRAARSVSVSPHSGIRCVACQVSLNGSIVSSPWSSPASLACMKARSTSFIRG